MSKNAPRKKSRRSGSLSKSEKSSSIIFKVIGLLFVLLAVYNLLENGFLNDLRNFLLSLLNSSDQNTAVIGKNPSGDALIDLICVYSPILSVLSICWFFADKNRSLTYYLNIGLIFLLTFLNSKITIETWVHLEYFSYHNYMIASIFLIVTMAILLMNYTIHKRPLLLLFINLYFYAFIFQLIFTRYSSIFAFKYCYIIALASMNIYSGVIYFFNKKTSSKFNLPLHFLVSYCFAAIYFLRQVYAVHSISGVTLFLVMSFIYFTSFFIFLLFTDSENKKRTYIIFNWLNTILFLLGSYSALSLYSHIAYFPLAVLAALSVHLLYFILAKKHELLKERLFAVETGIVFLLPFLLSSLLPSFSTELFFGSLSVTTILYAKENKNKYFIWFSLFSGALLTVNLLAIPTNTLYNILGFKNPENEMLKAGIISSGTTLLSFLGLRRIFQTLKKPKSDDFLKRKTYMKLLEAAVLFSLLIFAEWAAFSILFVTTGTMQHAVKIFFITASVFTLYLFKTKKISPDKSKQSLYYLVFIYAVFNVVTCFLQFPYLDYSKLEVSTFIISHLFVHYADAILITIVLIKSYVGFNEMFSNSRKKLLNFIQLAFSILFITLLCQEYDCASIMFSYFVAGFNSIEIGNILESNLMLPYSLIILLSSMALFIFGIVNKNKEVRFFSILLVGSVLAKVFLIDFNYISSNEQLAILTAIGGAFLLISWIYSRVNNERKSSRKRTRVSALKEQADS